MADSKALLSRMFVTSMAVTATLGGWIALSVFERGPGGEAQNSPLESPLLAPIDVPDSTAPQASPAAPRTARSPANPRRPAPIARTRSSR
jgi:hypothetical protein